MKDLTKIKTPFGLLGKKTRNALREHHDAGGEIDCWDYETGWRNCEDPMWARNTPYRVKPADPIAVLSEMQTEVFKKVLTCDALIKRAMQSETAATVPAIFAAVKEWQEAVRDGRIATNGTCDLIGAKAHSALMAIKAP